jgi:16S rRNA (guanine527-N7)-methyltransferase
MSPIWRICLEPGLTLEILCEAAATVGVRTDEEFRRRFARYAELIESANSRFNLTGAKGWERLRDELFIRSMRFLAPVAGGQQPAVEWFSGRKVLDIGSGAGIPGIVLKIAVPDMSLTLLDSSQKKTAFLREAVVDLGFDDVEVVAGRAEDIGLLPKHREKYDLVVSRGVAKLVELAELALPFASVGGTVISAKGPSVAAEIEESAYAVDQLGGAPAITATVASPGTTATDTMVYWMKIGKTPSIYPRRNGLPHTRPLVKVAKTVVRR